MTTTQPTAAERRLDKLTMARREASRAKTTQALAAVERLHAAGEPVTFARVARTAAVSTWFTYNNDQVAGAIRQAQADQAENGLRPLPQPAERVTAASLRVDLAHSRDEVRVLKEQIGHLHRALSSKLGAELEGVDSAAMLAKAKDLEQHNLDLARQLASSSNDRQLLQDQLTDAQADLAAARETLRRTIRPVP